jgi:hypothetical protein
MLDVARTAFLAALLGIGAVTIGVAGFLLLELILSGGPI